MGSQLPRVPTNCARPLGTLDGLLAGILGMTRTHKPRALDPLGSLEPSGLPIWQRSQAIPK